MDIEMLNAMRVIIKEELAPVNSRLDGLEKGQNEMRADIAELRGDVAELKSDVAELQRGQVEMRADIAELKSDVAGLKIDVAELQRGQTQMRADIEDLRDSLRRNHEAVVYMEVVHGNNLQKLADGVDALNSEVKLIRTEMLHQAQEINELKLIQ